MKSVYTLLCAACVATTAAWGQAPATEAAQPVSASETFMAVQIANMDTLVQASAKVGELMGNPMLGAMASMTLAQDPNLSKHMAKGADEMAVCTLVWTKDEDGDDDLDAKWTTAPTALDGALVRVVMPPSGFAKLAQVMEKGKDEVAADKRATFDDLIVTVRMVELCEIAFKVGDAGLETFGTVVPVAGSDLAQVGTVPLAADPLGFAPATALSASACAANSGSAVSPVEQLQKILDILTKNGVKTDWLQIVRDGVTSRVTFDCAAAVRYFTGEGKEAAQKLKPEMFEGEAALANLKGATRPVVGGPAMNTSFSLVGAPATTSPGARFQKVLPEAAAKQPVAVSVSSCYALLKSVAGDCVVLAPQEKATALKSLLATLPPPGDGATATAIWRDGNKFGFLSRLSADEFRNIAVAVQTVGTYVAMSGLNACASCDDDDDVEVDVDDDDDDDADDDD